MRNAGLGGKVVAHSIGITDQQRIIGELQLQAFAQLGLGHRADSRHEVQCLAHTVAGDEHVYLQPH